MGLGFASPLVVIILCPDESDWISTTLWIITLLAPVGRLKAMISPVRSFSNGILVSIATTSFRCRLGSILLERTLNTDPILGQEKFLFSICTRSLLEGFIISVVELLFNG